MRSLSIPQSRISSPISLQLVPTISGRMIPLAGKWPRLPETRKTLKQRITPNGKQDARPKATEHGTFRCRKRRPSIRRPAPTNAPGCLEETRLHVDFHDKLILSMIRNEFHLTALTLPRAHFPILDSYRHPLYGDHKYHDNSNSLWSDFDDDDHHHQ